MSETTQHPNFKFPELTAEARERCAGDDTPIAQEAIHTNNVQQATALLSNWNDQRVDDMLIVGGDFHPLRTAARAHHADVRAGLTKPKETRDLALELLPKDAEFTKAVLRQGSRPIEPQASHVERALASGRSGEQSR